MCMPDSQIISEQNPNWRLFNSYRSNDCDKFWENTRNAFLAKTRELKIPDQSALALAGWIVPVALWVIDTKNSQEECLVLGVNGAQGSGKTTFCELLTVLLEVFEEYRVCGFSIDDIYLTRKQRTALSETVHPLLKTRGVPGTHDVALGLDTIHQLKSADDDSKVLVPCFDKAVDDRVPREFWKTWEGQCDIVIFEGWCVGAMPFKNFELPINDLEENEDREGTWRHYVNEALAGPYTELFGLIDRLVMIKAPSFECVLNWRNEQERKLEESVAKNGAKGRDLKIMSKNEIVRFIAHYERVTRENLSKLAPRADILVDIDTNRNHISTQIKEPK